MNDTLERLRLEAKKKQLKLMMVIMLFFIVAGPLLGPKIFAEEFSHLNDAGRLFFYISTPTAFAALLLFDLCLYRRVARKLRGEK
jgi:hypothetical protein